MSDEEWADFREMIDEEGIGEYSDALVDLCVPTLRLRPTDHSELRSRLGGLPDVPPGFAWPVGDPLIRGASGELGAAQSMDFVAQIDLADVAAANLPGSGVLPRSGTLAFFHGYRNGLDDKHSGSAGAVFYFAPDVPLARAKAPAGLMPLPLVHVVFEVSTEVLPPIESPFYAVLLAEQLSSTNPYGAAADHFGGLVGCYGQQGVRDEEARPIHRLFGYADPLQSDPYVNTEANSSAWPFSTPYTLELFQRAAKWRLLLQLDSDPERGTTYGDGGVLAFMMRQEDLAAGRYECAWVEFQGH